VFRLPGATTAWLAPRATHSSTRVAQNVACAVTSLTGHDDTGRSVVGVIVEVWSDVVCPWCYIGKRRFEAAAARLADDPEFDHELDVVYRPFQLDPNAPPGTTMPAVEAYARKFGGLERAAGIIDHVTNIAAAEKLEFHLDRALRANTRDAHRTLWYAGQSGLPGAQVALKERLLAAYFTDGSNIADPDLLATEAARAGLDRDDVLRLLEGDEGIAEVADSLAFAAAAGITAVPTYVLDGRWSIPGAQDPDVFVQVLRRLADRADRAG
jgi:predicted DsbA family dithiol-disulfide isomerase